MKKEFLGQFSSPVSSEFLVLALRQAPDPLEALLIIPISVCVCARVCASVHVCVSARCVSLSILSCWKESDR